MAMQLRVTLSPTITGRTGLSRITEDPDGQIIVIHYGGQQHLVPHCVKGFNPLLCTVMLMVSLLCPAADSHQYTPASAGYSVSQKQWDLFPAAPEFSHSWSMCLDVFLFTLHQKASPCCPQLTERDSYWKNWDLLGRTFRVAAGDRQTVANRDNRKTQVYISVLSLPVLMQMKSVEGSCIYRRTAKTAGEPSGCRSAPLSSVLGFSAVVCF